VAGRELRLALHRVDADSDRLGAHSLELRREITEVTGLSGASRGQCRRVEEQHHRTFGEQFTQPARLALLVQQLEVRNDVANVHRVHPLDRRRDMGATVARRRQ
jgi:hypothetical protein